MRLGWIALYERQDTVQSKHGRGHNIKKPNGRSTDRGINTLSIETEPTRRSSSTQVMRMAPMEQQRFRRRGTEQSAEATEVWSEVSGGGKWRGAAESLRSLVIPANIVAAATHTEREGNAKNLDGG